MPQQPALDLKQGARSLPRIPAEPASSDYPMAGNDDGKGIGAAGSSDGARSAAQAAGEASVGFGTSRRNPG